MRPARPERRTPRVAARSTRRPAAKAAAVQQRPPQMSLSVQLATAASRIPVDRAQLRRWVRSALERDAALTLRFVDEVEGRALNKAYRGRDYATNVLTFAYDDDAQAPGDARGRAAAAADARGAARFEPPVRGDIVLCMPVLAREARAQRKPLRSHLAHLVIHGVLHAQGWDHETLAEAQRMERRETELLRRFRIDDPYR